jgi:hypothetical protein
MQSTLALRAKGLRGVGGRLSGGLELDFLRLGNPLRCVQNLQQHEISAFIVVRIIPGLSSSLSAIEAFSLRITVRESVAMSQVTFAVFSKTC